MDPHRQVIRAHHHTPGPDPRVLHALYAAVHEHAAHQRTGGSGPTAAVAHHVWAAAYPLAFHDARAVLAHRVRHAALEAFDVEPDRAGLDHATAPTQPARPRVPPLSAPLLASIDRALGDGRDGWRRAVDRLWTDALITGATDALAGLTADSTSALTGSGPAFAAWLRTTLTQTRQVVLGEWRQAASHRHTPTEPTSLAPRTDVSTVDVLPLVPAAIAAVPAGRAR
jgi:hypothetical protein